jgi:hypothetical protein
MTTAIAVTDTLSAARPSVQIHPVSRRIMHWVNALENKNLSPVGNGRSYRIPAAN